MSGETKPFNERLDEGHKYEDFVADTLWNYGIVLWVYRSKERQWESGESRMGAEIKLDNRWPETGRLFIECSERRDESGKSIWRPAGIYDKTNPWLYVIGNYTQLWVHGVTTLRLLHEQKRFSEKETPTATGFVIPIADANKYALKVIDVAGTAQGLPPTSETIHIPVSPDDNLADTIRSYNAKLGITNPYLEPHNRPLETWPDKATANNQTSIFGS